MDGDRTCHAGGEVMEKMLSNVSPEKQGGCRNMLTVVRSDENSLLYEAENQPVSKDF